MALSAGREATVARRAESEPVTLPTEEAAEVEMENGTNVWPDEAAETVFLEEQRASADEAATAVVSKAKEEQPELSLPLPALEELVNRLAPETLEMLDDLFRAKFVSVRRVPKDVLKS